jgi:hypothetical protein
VLLIPFTRDPSDCSVSLSNVNRAISTLAPSTAHRLQLHSLGSGFWLVYAELYRRKKNVGHALRSIVHRLLLRLRTRMLLCISAAIWRCQVSTQSHDMAFRVVGHPNVTKRARTTVLATMVCCRCGLGIRFTSASRPSMTIFPHFWRTERRKKLAKTFCTAETRDGIYPSRFCMLQRHIDVPRLEGIFRNPARPE